MSIARIDYNAPFTLTLFIAALGMMFLARLLDLDALPMLVAQGDLRWGDPYFYSGLLLHPLAHGSWQHFLANFTILLLIGPMLEEKYGSGALALLALATAVLTGLLHAIFFSGGLIGASGLVFMAILLSSFARCRGGTLPLTFLLVVVLYLGHEVLAAMESNNTSEFAHIIGGICGAAFGFFKR
ncbi:MAG: rhomboid family intramembrane serine protease [Verrucomicrobiota bacterium]